MVCEGGRVSLRTCLCGLLLSLAQVARAHPVYWAAKRAHVHCQHPTLGYGFHANPRPDDEIGFRLVHAGTDTPLEDGEWVPGATGYQLIVENVVPMEYFVTTTVGILWQWGTNYAACGGKGWYSGGGRNEINRLNITMPACCEVKSNKMVIFASGAGGRQDYYSQNYVTFTGNLDSCNCDASELEAVPDPVPPIPGFPMEGVSSGASSGLPTWAAAVIAVGAIAIVAAIALASFLFVRHRRAQRQVESPEMSGSYSKWNTEETEQKPQWSAPEVEGKPRTLDEC